MVGADWVGYSGGEDGGSSVAVVWFWLVVRVSSG